MDKEDSNLRYKEKLLELRKDLLGRLQRLETSWQTLGERDIELEEEAQKADITRLFTQLDELEQKKLEEIDLALNKLAAGRFGMCERCRKMISSKRLEALPTARLCRKCAAAVDSQGQRPLPQAREILAKFSLSESEGNEVSEQDEFTDDIFESQEEEIPYTAPDRPPSEE